MPQVVRILRACGLGNLTKSWLRAHNACLAMTYLVFPQSSPMWTCWRCENDDSERCRSECCFENENDASPRSWEWICWRCESVDWEHAEVNAVDEGKYALHGSWEWRSRRRSVDSDGADVNAVQYYNRTAYSATNDGHVNIVSVASEWCRCGYVDGLKWTPLHLAVMSGHVVIVKVLVRVRADVNAVINSKTTALHLAACHGHADVAKVLIQNGVSWMLVIRKMTALHMAAAGTMTLRKCWFRTVPMWMLPMIKIGQHLTSDLMEMLTLRLCWFERCRRECSW